MQFPIYTGRTSILSKHSNMMSLHGEVCKGALGASQSHQPQLLWRITTVCTPALLWRTSASSGTPCPTLLPSTPGLQCLRASHPSVPIPDHLFPPVLVPQPLSTALQTPQVVNAIGWLQSALAPLWGTPKHPRALCILVPLQSIPDPPGNPAPQLVQRALPHICMPSHSSAPTCTPHPSCSGAPQHPAPRSGGRHRSPPPPSTPCPTLLHSTFPAPASRSERPQRRRLRYETRPGRGGAAQRGGQWWHRQLRHRRLPPVRPGGVSPRRDGTGRDGTCWEPQPCAGPGCAGRGGDDVLGRAERSGSMRGDPAVAVVCGHHQP